MIQIKNYLLRSLDDICELFELIIITRIKHAINKVFLSSFFLLLFLTKIFEFSISFLFLY